MEELVDGKKRPTKLELLNLTKSNTIKEACCKLGIHRSTWNKWRTEGISDRVYNKYWGNNVNN